MIYISKLIIPLIVVIVIIYGFIKKIDIYSVFIEGVKEGLRMVLNIFPTIFTMVLAINILVKSNFIIDMANSIGRILNIFHIPRQILPLAILRPISGSSSLIMLDSILANYGPDSYIGRIGSILQGSTDTTIYIISLYFGSIGIKKTKYALFVGLITDFFCLLVSIMIVNMFFY